jgi:hypothetical protein
MFFCILLDHMVVGRYFSLIQISLISYCLNWLGEEQECIRYLELDLSQYPDCDRSYYVSFMYMNFFKLQHYGPYHA